MQQQTPEQQLWNFFDAKYVLSTPNSNRKQALGENFRAVGLDTFEIVEFAPSETYTKSRKNNSSGVLGLADQSVLSTIKHKVCDETCQNIAQNMFTLAKKGYDAGANAIVIFEDDARFSIPFKTKRFAKAIQWMMTHEWDIFYLGYCQWPKLLSWFVTPEIVKLTSPLCLHGYCLSRKGMEKVIKMSNYYKIAPQHIDKLYGQKKWQKYGIFPAICFQSEDPALYKKVLEKLPVNVKFKALSRFTEYGSLSLPFVVLIALLIIIVHTFFKK